MMATTAQPAQTGGIFVGQSPRVDASEQLILGLLLKVAKKGRSVELRAVRPNFTEVGDDGLLKLSEFKDLQIRRGKDWLLLRGLRNWQELVLDPSSFEEICYYVVACQRELEEARRIRMVQRVREKKISSDISFSISASWINCEGCKTASFTIKKVGEDVDGGYLIFIRGKWNFAHMNDKEIALFGKRYSQKTLDDILKQANLQLSAK